jgi:hypothetical protein
MTHAELQYAVQELLALFGWRWLHVRRSVGYRKGQGRAHQTTTNVAGWPDLWCWNPAQPGRWLAIELKVPPDTLNADQAAVLNDLASAGAESIVVTPMDLQWLAGRLRPQS